MAKSQLADLEAVDGRQQFFSQLLEVEEPILLDGVPELL
jgi:hypothetical protein